MDTLLYGGLCALMVEFARCAPVEQRRQAVQVAGIMCGVWVLFSLAWFRPFAPAHLLRRAGLPATHEDMWTLVDALAGAAVLALAFDRAWSWVLWALLFGQVVTVSWYHLIGQQYADYSAIMNALFLGQVAVFGVIGGRGFGDRISRYFNSRRLYLGAKSSRAVHSGQFR